MADPASCIACFTAALATRPPIGHLGTTGALISTATGGAYRHLMMTAHDVYDSGNRIRRNPLQRNIIEPITTVMVNPRGPAERRLRPQRASFAPSGIRQPSAARRLRQC